MTTFHCENWTAVIAGLALLAAPGFVLWQTVRSGRFKLRFGPVVDSKRQPRRFRTGLAVYALVIGGTIVLLASQLAERCAGT